MTNDITHSTPAPRWHTGVIKHWKKLLILLLWVTIVAIYWRASQNIAPTAQDKIVLLSTWFRAQGWGPLLFLLLYSLQPLVFFPTFVMTILAGMLYGPVVGMIIAVLGMNGAASVSYATGRFMGAEVLQDASNAQVQKYMHQLRSNTFETLLTLHLLYVPFDLLSYIAGAMRVRWRPFAIATILGTIPSGLAYVLLGNSFGPLEQMAAGNLDVNYPLLITSLLLAVGVFTGTRYSRRRRATTST